MAKKSAGSKRVAKKGAKKAHRKPKRSWARWVSRAAKKAGSKTMSSRAMAIMNSMCNDMFDRLATEAANVARVHKVKTLGCRELQTAVRLTFPEDLAKHAMGHATANVSGKH